MDYQCKLIEKTFTDKENNKHKYYALQFTLSTGDTLDITIKGDKAKLLKLSNQTDMPSIDRDIWEDR